MSILILLIVLFLIDLYAYQAVLTVTKNLSPVWRSSVRLGYWLVTAIIFGAIFWYYYGNPYKYGSQLRNVVLVGIFITYFSKVFGLLFVFIDDLQRGARWIVNYFSKGSENPPGQAIPRSEFLAKTAVIAAAVPFTAMVYGILSGAHDYRVRRKTIYLPNLPKSFDGIRIGQLSDIHSGSFFNKTAVKGGVEMFLKEKPDVIFFTGDLVNNQTDEVKDYVSIFSKLKAPHGVFSITGNHDYGDYKQWSIAEAKQKNFKDLEEAHNTLVYDNIKKEHRNIEKGGDRIAILGNEN
jgi:predicted phosphodiesterase